MPTRYTGGMGVKTWSDGAHKGLNTIGEVEAQPLFRPILQPNGRPALSLGALRSNRGRQLCSHKQTNKPAKWTVWPEDIYNNLRQGIPHPRQTHRLETYTEREMRQWAGIIHNKLRQETEEEELQAIST